MLKYNVLFLRSLCTSLWVFPGTEELFVFINALSLNGALSFELHPSRKPHRGRSRRNAGKQSCLRGCPQSKQSSQRIAAQNDSDVFRQCKPLLQRGDHLLCQKVQRVRCIAAETLFAPYRRSFPRGKFIVPTFHRNRSKQKRMCCALCNGCNFVVHALQFVFIRHLKQKIFGAVCAVNTAGSISDLNLLCGHGNCLLKNF